MLNTIKEGFESLKTIKKDKQEYRAYLNRVKALPDDYEFVYNRITHYMWSLYGGGNGHDLLAIQVDLLELFEGSAAEKKPVLEITGEDVAAFSDELLRNAKTYTGNWREKLNRDVRTKLGGKDNEL